MLTIYKENILIHKFCTVNLRPGFYSITTFSHHINKHRMWNSNLINKNKLNLPKAEKCFGRNVQNITMKMKSIV